MIIASLFSLLLSGFGLSNIGTTQADTRDREREDDINTLYSHLEIHYNEYGMYPTEEELTKDYDLKLPGLDPKALIDPNGNKIQAGDYKYEPAGCSAIGCKHYGLSATLENNSTYTKQSIN